MGGKGERLKSKIAKILPQWINWKVEHWTNLGQKLYYTLCGVGGGDW